MTAPAPVPDPFDLGVLFVHGIGEQKRGETLVGCGDPLFNWLQEWLDGIRKLWAAQDLTRHQIGDWFDALSATWAADPDFNAKDIIDRSDVLRPLIESVPRGSKATGPERWDPVAMGKTLNTDVLAGKVELLDCTARPHGGGPPASTQLRLTLFRTDGTVLQQRWLLSESWWARTFEAPSFVEILKLGLFCFPWIILAHFCRKFERSREDSILAFLNGCCGFLIAFLAVSVLEAVMLALAALALPPIDGLRKAVSWVQRKFAGFIGDSYVFLHSPLQGSSMVSQVVRDGEWISDQCRHLVILGHSQGAAVLFESLRTLIPEKLEAICTYGSGLRKLEELRLALQEGSTQHAARVGVFVSFVMTLTSTLVAMFRGWSSAPGLAALAVAVAAWVYAVVRCSRREPFQKDLPKVTFWRSWLEVNQVRWLDLHASCDPVSNGKLFDGKEASKDSPEDIEVFNRGSVWTDHTTYWDSPDDFVARVVRLLAGVSTFPLGEDETLLAACRGRRRTRVAALATVRILALVLVALSLAAVALAFRGTGENPIVGLGSWLLRQGRSFLPVESLQGVLLAQTLAGTAGVLLGCCLTYAVVVGLGWVAWDEAELRLLWSRSKSPGSTGGRVFFVAMAVVYGVLVAGGTGLLIFHGACR